MAVRYWKRMRERTVAAREEAPDRDLNPWDEPVATVHSDDAVVTVSRLDQPGHAPTSSDRAAQYSDWAERMRIKREQAKARIQAASTPDGADSRRNVAQPGPTYWTTDALYAESRRVAEEEAGRRPDPTRTAALLATLGLGEDATPGEVASAYRRLAKDHHPDRFVEADETVRQHHADRMRDINRAYRSLKQLQLA